MRNQTPSTRRRALSRALLGAIGTLAFLQPAAAQADPRSDAASALSRGDGVAAARIILERGWSEKPPVLADIIYDGGALAVERGSGDAYADALPVAYLRGSVPYAVANASFGLAAMSVVGRGVTPEQGRVGALAVARTNAAYLGLSRRAADRRLRALRRATSRRGRGR